MPYKDREWRLRYHREYYIKNREKLRIDGNAYSALHIREARIKIWKCL